MHIIHEDHEEMRYEYQMRQSLGVEGGQDIQWNIIPQKCLPMYCFSSVIRTPPCKAMTNPLVVVSQSLGDSMRWKITTLAGRRT